MFEIGSHELVYYLLPQPILYDISYGHYFAAFSMQCNAHCQSLNDGYLLRRIKAYNSERRRISFSTI